MVTSHSITSRPRQHRASTLHSLCPDPAKVEFRFWLYRWAERTQADEWQSWDPNLDSRNRFLTPGWAATLFWQHRLPHPKKEPWKQHLEACSFKALGSCSIREGFWEALLNSERGTASEILLRTSSKAGGGLLPPRLQHKFLLLGPPHLSIYLKGFIICNNYFFAHHRVLCSPWPESLLLYLALMLTSLPLNRHSGQKIQKSLTGWGAELGTASGM